MPAIFLQEPLAPLEIAALKQEFPHYDLIFESCEGYFGQVEILYGNQLTERQLKKASRLRWIHTHNADTEGLCIPEIRHRNNILLTLTKGQNIPQMAEFVLGAILAFAKQFFHWTQVTHDPQEFWQWPLKETMWTLSGKILLQVGLGEVGSAVVKRANAFGMRTWGVRPQKSFHPYCHKTFSLDSLNSLLPAVDIVVLALPKQAQEKVLFDEEALHLIKNDSIFIVVGSAASVDEHALAKVAATGKFRGILLDAFRHPPPAKNSSLWDMPNGVLTPSIASYPESEEHTSFRLFRRNLRLFIQNKTGEMKNLFRL